MCGSSGAGVRVLQASNNARVAHVLVSALCGQGVCEAVLSPGSRSTPLAFALHASSMRVHVALDERAAGFFALGMARVSGRPVVLVCTSGSALAHYLPAVVEAYHAGVPLVVLSADRPLEVRGWGAAQTIQQEGLYGPYVKYQASLDAAQAEEVHLRGVAHTAVRAWDAAYEGKGPVHVNVAFREPLWEASLHPCDPLVRSVKVLKTQTTLDAEECLRVLQWMQAGERGVVVCGPCEPGGAWEAQAVALAEALGWPLLAEPVSQVRFAGVQSPCVLHAYEALLRTPSMRALLKPDRVLRFGAWPTSKSVAAYLEEQSVGCVVHVEQSAQWRDPSFVDTWYVPVSPPVFLQEALRCVQPSDSGRWLDMWVQAHAAVISVLDKKEESRGVWEGAVVASLVQNMPEGAGLHVASSMPVRDLEVFGHGAKGAVPVFANRGANGIEGVVATALGEACVWGKPFYVLTGELSFLHDVGGLALACEVQGAVTFVVIHNGGGGIFGFLPVAQHPDAFEKLFLTPQGTSIEHVCKAYGVQWCLAETMADLKGVLAQRALDESGVCVVEVRVDRVWNQQVRQAVLDEASVCGRAVVESFLKR